MPGTVLCPRNAAVNKTEENSLLLWILQSRGKASLAPGLEIPEHMDLFCEGSFLSLSTLLPLFFLSFQPESLGLELWEARNDRKIFVMSNP